jgi:hypothetical protein
VAWAGGRRVGAWERGSAGAWGRGGTGHAGAWDYLVLLLVLVLVLEVAISRKPEAHGSVGAWEHGGTGRGLYRGTGVPPVIPIGRTGGSPVYPDFESRLGQPCYILITGKMPVPRLKAATRRHTASLWATPQVSIGQTASAL